MDLKPGTIYQAIKTIRAELNLPAYNDPDLHASEFEEIKRKAREAREAREAAKAALAAQAAALASEQAQATEAATSTIEPASASTDQASEEVTVAETQGVPVLTISGSSENEQQAEQAAE